MIGLDTNVLLRYIVKDDAKQFARAKRLIEARARPEDPAWVGLIAVSEFVWALRTRYRYSRELIVDVLERLLDSQEVQFERQHLVAEALSLFRSGRADFADALIALVSLENGCEKTFSFDRQLVRSGLAEEP